MASKIEEKSITGQIQNELQRLKIKCNCTEGGLVWFTDTPIHKKSVNIQSMYKHILSEPYMTSLGFKTAEKFLDELRRQTNGDTNNQH